MKMQLFLLVASLLVCKNAWTKETEPTQVAQEAIHQANPSSLIEASQDGSVEQFNKTLKAAEPLTPEQLLKLLNTRNDDGDTALICASRKRSSIDMVNSILKAAERLTPEQLLELLSAKNKQGKNALMLAVYDHYGLDNTATAKALLDAAERLTPEQIFQLLNARDYQLGAGDNVLMMTAVGSPKIETINAILKATEKLTPEQLLKLFNAGDRHGSTILMMADGRNFVDAILKSAERLTTNQFLELLNAKNNHDGNTAFTRAVYWGHQSVAIALLEAAKKRNVSDALLQQLK